jgi:DNA-binding transcriptional regulator YhcF (GntR family)
VGRGRGHRELLKRAPAARTHRSAPRGDGVLSVGQTAKALELSVPTANAAFKNLVDAGILRQLDERKRNRVFLAAEVLERLDRPPG